MLSEMLSLYSWYADPKEFPPSPSSDLFDVEHLIGQNQCKVVDLIILFSENIKITFLENSGRICQIFFFITCGCDCVCGGQRTKVRGPLVEVSFFLFPPRGSWDQSQVFR